MAAPSKRTHEREYLDNLGQRWRMVPKGSAQHHPEYIKNLEMNALQKAAGAGKKLIPHDITAQAYKLALELPTLEDIAAALTISPQLLADWRKANPEIDIAIARARRKKTTTMTAVVEKQALDGSLKAIDMWMRWFRKDLSMEVKAPATTNLNLQLNIIPPAANTKDWFAERDESEVIEQSDELKSATPLFKGRF